MRRLILIAATATISALAAGTALSQDAKMSFFVTSVGSGKGADLGGLKGADAHCASLAEAAGVTGKTWAAYLSTSTEDARDRIGKGPWVNAKGIKIADDVASLHGDANGITKQTALTEKGEMVNGRGDTPNRHDMLTGSKPDGTRIADQTCGDWTMSGTEGAAMMGHHDRTGLDDSAAAKSWNSSHASRGGCGQEALKGTGGDGLFYCFATN
ncbi:MULTISPECIES: hypothetical protein [unclassified Mesorhizobium]|uniref:hypothetical protein n=1 Tax=unclassified Mesorhizobium TaxID=325217 RepID=UPI001128D784|nr:MULTISPECIES: hypothetical protein [unclassified Mesorhizobium]TPI56636.1 hypothetical protein FJW11_03105 [Mesorhizobium sp. B3-1-1]TPJ59591.1 hypothetical protein FJ462_29565 [Mesorhizobium sp. B2-6-7]TPJ88816.1 hypothetical protein FJ422_02775 [Mesorhizobium sp. B2-6-3]TPK03897.1 hypothetical protein FJ491_02775 [Mesorhizobium sp. B2-5-10]TPK14336.1 hypothetical protein FJ490_03170 [Mesorhizobium sp. B2-5-11]